MGRALVDITLLRLRPLLPAEGRGGVEGAGLAVVPEGLLMVAGLLAVVGRLPVEGVLVRGVEEVGVVDGADGLAAVGGALGRAAGALLPPDDL